MKTVERGGGNGGGSDRGGSEKGGRATAVKNG